MKSKLSSVLAGLALLMLTACVSSETSSTTASSGNYVMLFNYIPHTLMRCDHAEGYFGTDRSKDVQISTAGSETKLIIKVYTEQQKLLGTVTLYVGQTGRISKEHALPEPLGASWQGATYKVMEYDPEPVVASK